MKIVARSLVAALVLTGLRTAQTVHVVDSAGGPGTDFTALSDAAAAAASGDFLLVRSGAHFLTAITGKALVVQADEGADVGVDQLLIENLPAGGAVVVRGLVIDGGGSFSPSIIVRDCAGSVWFEDCIVPGVFQPFFAGGASLRDCASVVFDGCRLDAPVLIHPDVLEPTLRSVRSTVYLFDTQVEGRDGVDQMLLGAPSDGSDAIDVEDGALWIMGTEVTGGDGGDGTLGCVAGQDAGSALLLRGTDPEAFVQDSTLVAGARGLGSGGCPTARTRPTST